jgi:hypothetical protein
VRLSLDESSECEHDQSTETEIIACSAPDPADSNSISVSDFWEVSADSAAFVVE